LIKKADFHSLKSERKIGNNPMSGCFDFHLSVSFDLCIVKGIYSNVIGFSICTRVLLTAFH